MDRTHGSLAELVCADQEWLHAEFDAIVAANFGAAAPDRAQPPAGPRQLDLPSPHVPASPFRPVSMLPTPTTPPGRQHRPRQRSPPSAGRTFRSSSPRQLTKGR
ncbi:hypothetical protein [Amycolatopsis aidingensis]|uniref:hypothetical protein n=1 Tax=Amycolatopsis aidingensis TaxID=2842453 RepID=UPI001C0CF65E|nr:hypothetical protein [Amycolatopsis aidingensis]